jgi:hypothetical protein
MSRPIQLFYNWLKSKRARSFCLGSLPSMDIIYFIWYHDMMSCHDIVNIYMISYMISYMIYHIMYPWYNFPRFFAFFPRFSTFFHRFHSKALDLSKSCPIRRFVRRSDDCPILKKIPLFFYLRRLGGVGAPEGRDKVPDISYQIFPRISF